MKEELLYLRLLWFTILGFLRFVMLLDDVSVKYSVLLFSQCVLSHIFIFPSSCFHLWWQPAVTSCNQNYFTVDTIKTTVQRDLDRLRILVPAKPKPLKVWIKWREALQSLWRLSEERQYVWNTDIKSSDFNIKIVLTIVSFCLTAPNYSTCSNFNTMKLLFCTELFAQTCFNRQTSVWQTDAEKWISSVEKCKNINLMIHSGLNLWAAVN